MELLMLKVIVHLNTDKSFETALKEGYSIEPIDFTSATIWKFVSRDKKDTHFLAGDRISMIELVK
jgi:hypothetical protein